MSHLIRLDEEEKYFYSKWLFNLIDQANGKGNQKNNRFFLKKIFETSWEEIKRMTRGTEGAVWYVWWMDGVHNFALYDKTGKFGKEYSL